MMFVTKDRYGKQKIIEAQHCYFDRYKIEDDFYWFYNEDGVYHLERKSSESVIYIAVAKSASEFIEKSKEVIEAFKNIKSSRTGYNGGKVILPVTDLLTSLKKEETHD